ncbi:MAG: PocR ligand-binding domain-containing protein [Bacteroidota bacterium]
MTNEHIDITSIVNTSILQEFPDAFYEGTGLITGIQSLDGELITSVPKHDFCAFCKNMYFSREGHRRCLESNRHGAHRAFELKGPYIYHCHAGLIDVAAPIIVAGRHAATVTFGQILLKEPDAVYRRRVRKLLSGLPENLREKQLKALDHVNVLPLRRVRGLASLLYAIANNVVNLIVSNLKEKELNIQQVKLIDEIRANSLLEKEIQNARLRLKEAELKALQAQISPHFLYNTLDSIQWLALLHGAKDIQEMTYALGQLLRHSLDRKQTVITLRKEIEQVRSYLGIQGIRFGEKISYQIAVEPEILDFRLPKLVLQPLVENAVMHGLEPKATPGRIYISGWLESEDRAIIEVADDGIGLPEGMDLDLNGAAGPRRDGAEERVSSGRMGLVNVHKRLIYCFGEDYGLEIRSRLGEGTTIRFRVPRDLNREF